MVHVDDISVVGPDSFGQTFVSQLSSLFEISSNEELHHFLSLDICRDLSKNLVYINQAHYIKEIANKFLSLPHATVQTPTDAHFKDLVPRASTKKSSPGHYQSLIGALLWVAQCTRADISFAVSWLSQCLRDLSESHWNAGLCVLSYLASASHLSLSLGDDPSVSGYSDSDWAEDQHDRRSTTGYSYRWVSGPISWRTRKQATVSLSSTESEYKAMSDACREGLWLQNLLSELQLRPPSSIPLHVDNEGAEALAKNPTHHSCTKHIHTRYHFVRECVADKSISIHHVSSKDMLANMLTKPLGRVLLQSHRYRFGIV